jgi:monomeric isocitrate dehydrogenase
MYYKTTRSDSTLAEWMNDADMREVLPDMAAIEAQNAVYRDIMVEKDRGRPGHYFGRDVVIEAQMPAAMLHAAALEFGGDPDWWKDDAKFQDYMKRHPSFSLLNG